MTGILSSRLITNLSIFLLASLILGLTPLATVQAVTMSPIRLEMASDPGQSSEGVVKVYNDENAQRTFYISVAKFESKDETGQPTFIPGNDELVQWVTIQSSVDLGPYEAKEVPFTVNIPNGVDPGGYFAAIFASVIPPSPEGNAVALRSDVGTLLLFRVNGDFVEGETILEFSTKDGRKVFNHLPVEFFYRFQNDGDDRAKPLGDITIRNLFGGLSKIIEANHGGGNTLPKSVRRYDAAWITAGGDDTEHEYGKIAYPEFENFWEAVQYQVKNFALGYYSAELQVTVNNDSSRSYTKQTSFWVLPWQLLVVIAAVLIVFVLPLALLVVAAVVYWRKKRRKNLNQ